MPGTCLSCAKDAWRGLDDIQERLPDTFGAAGGHRAASDGPTRTLSGHGERRRAIGLLDREVRRQPQSGAAP